MTCPRSHSSEWLIGTYAQVCPPARTSEAHVRGWKEALPPPPLVHLCHCPSMTSPARARVWVESWGFQRWPLPLQPPMTGISFIQSRLGGFCREWPKGHAVREERGEELGRDTLAPLVQPPARALPPAQGGTESSQARGHCQPGQPRGSRCAGMASCCHCSCRRPGLPPPMARPAGGPPFSGDTHCPSAGHFANCLATSVHGPKSVTWCRDLEAQSGVGYKLYQEAPTLRVRSLSAPPPARPHTLALAPVLWLERGSPWAQGDTNAPRHSSGS